MSRRNVHRSRAAAALVIASVLAMALLAGSRPGHAADKGRYVEGIVTSVSGTEIQVGGKTYNLARARFVTGPRGEPSPELAAGRKVTLYLRGDVVLSVLVYPKAFLE